MNSLHLLKACIIYYLVLQTSSSFQENSDLCTRRHNILIILIDDMRHLTDQDVYLSNIQKLAANGISFQNAYAQQALCAPSRNSILTGRRPDALRLYDFYSYWRDFVGNFTTFPELFKIHGYDTYSVGKVFHPGRSSNFTDDYPYSWSEVPYHPLSEMYKNAATCKDKRTKKLQKNLICPVNISKQPDKTLPDIDIINHAINIIQNRTTKKPYLLAVGIHKPHVPLKFPRKYLDKVPIYNVRPPLFPQIPMKMPLVSWHTWEDVRSRDDIKYLNISFPFGLMPHKWTLKIIQSYYAASLYINDLLGKLLSVIDTKKTIVLLTSDHGWSLGENGLWAKYSNFDVALNVPLIFNVPGMAPKSINSIVELVDIFPTLVELAGLKVKIPKCKDIMDKKDLCIEGKSLLPLMLKHKTKLSDKTFAISQFPRPSDYPKRNSDKPRLKDIKIMGYSIRTNQYRYTEWVDFNSTLFTRNWNKIHGVELYNHYTDPYESNNLYLDPNYVHIKTELSKLLQFNVENRQKSLA